MQNVTVVFKQLLRNRSLARRAGCDMALVEALGELLLAYACFREGVTMEAWEAAYIQGKA